MTKFVSSLNKAITKAGGAVNNDIIARAIKSLGWHITPPKEATMVDAERIKELEDANARLVAECSHMETRMATVHILEDKIAKLEEELENWKVGNSRAWAFADELKHERDVTREAASEAVRLLQVELERLRNVSRETLNFPSQKGPVVP
jgi:predicted type IV restriction endonuclease